jgi:hypothetical protein
VSAPDKPLAKCLEEHIEALIDEALQETFPASDPPRPAVDVHSDKDKGEHHDR